MWKLPQLNAATLAQRKRDEGMLAQKKEQCVQWPNPGGLACSAAEAENNPSDNGTTADPEGTQAEAAQS